MKWKLLLIPCLTLFSGAAVADTTVLSVESASGTMTVTLEEDGTYTSDTGITGTWTEDGENLCVTRSTGESNCFPYRADAKPGESWQSEDAEGNPITITRQ